MRLFKELAWYSRLKRFNEIAEKGEQEDMKI